MPGSSRKSQDAGQERLQNRKIFCTGADCATRCRRIRHRRGRLQLAFTLETAARNPAKLLCRRPFGHGGADRRRQGGIQRCICRPVQRGTGGGERQNCRQHRRKGADECRQRQRTRSGDRGRFSLLILMVMSGFSSCGILFSGGTQVSGQTMYSAEDRDIRGAEQDYKKLEKELDKKIKRTPCRPPRLQRVPVSP